MSAKRIQRIFALMAAWMNLIHTLVTVLKAKPWQKMDSTVVVRFTLTSIGLCPNNNITNDSLFYLIAVCPYNGFEYLIGDRVKIGYNWW